MEKIWYVVKVLPGKERQLRDNLNLQISLDKLKNINRFVCPTEKTIILVRKKRTIREKVLYSGYLYFECNDELTDDQLKELTLVNGFMDLNGSKKPVKLKSSDVLKIIVDEKLENHERNKSLFFSEGETVIVNEGPFKNFEGRISKLTNDIVDLEIMIFGRLTDVTLSSEQISKKTN
jgi:transcriptional antiterminator NusG